VCIIRRTEGESVSDVLVRDNQLVATIESMYSGENVVIVAPDSDVLSILQAALSDDNPDAALPKHARFSFRNGEVRKLVPLVKPPEVLVTGQTKDEASATNRRMQALRTLGTSKVSKATADTWFDIWRMRVDQEM
jgi:broad specificity phosphatase PhoE